MISLDISELDHIIAILTDLEHLLEDEDIELLDFLIEIREEYDNR